MECNIRGLVFVSHSMKSIDIYDTQTNPFDPLAFTASIHASIYQHFQSLFYSPSLFVICIYRLSHLARSTTASPMRSTCTGSTGGNAMAPASIESLSLDLWSGPWTGPRLPMTPGGEITRGPAVGLTTRSRSPKATGRRKERPSLARITWPRWRSQWGTQNRLAQPHPVSKLLRTGSSIFDHFLLRC